MRSTRLLFTMDDHELQLQIPHFVYNNAPTLVPGGGAELLPASWFAQSAFQPGPCVHSTPFFPLFIPFFYSVFAQEPGLEEGSSSSPFEFSLPPAQPCTDQQPTPRPQPDLSAFLAVAPVPLGLPVYSASGFDLLSILARVATRPFPRIALGPVDLTCSFVVVDVRRFDNPIVYCSPSFCSLTGYPENEVIGRNCRFLQAPGGNVAKGEPRNFTSQDAVNHLRKSLIADKECQTSIVNYKKDGSAFINLVTVIPVPGGSAPDEHEIIYQVGFQVDLTEQPHAILEKLRDGSYLVNYASHSDLSPFGLPGHGPQRHNLAPVHLTGNAARDRKASAIPPIVMSKDLKSLLSDPTFLRSIPITNAPANSHTSSEDTGQNHPLSLILLEALPDFIHVVSLKGNFLYVAPSVRRVLGYEAHEMVGTSIADYAHPEDVIPLMRELKESSATGPSSTAAISDTANTQVVPHVGMPRSVDLLFRAKTKMGRYVWVECRGRLHVEPGKGRKAIILSGRAREMMNLKWKDVRRAGGLARSLRVPASNDASGPPTLKDVEQEVWGMLGGMCKDTATFMSVGKGMTDVLGWTSDDLLGRALMGIVCDEDPKAALGGFISSMRAYQKQQVLPPPRRGHPLDASRVRKLRCSLRRKDGNLADVWFIVYRADADADEADSQVDCPRGAGISITPAPLVYQIRLADAETMAPGAQTAMSPPQLSPAGKPASSLFSSSLSGAVPQPLFSSSPAASAAPSSKTAPPPPPSVDMFDELSTSRGSSWQYELQQLRITNLRLKEELAALEAAEAAATGKKAASQQQYHPAEESHLPPPQSSMRYDLNTSYDLPLPPPPPPQHRMYGEMPSQPLFTSHHRLDQSYRYDYEIPHPESSMQQQPYLHQPTPVAQYAQPHLRRDSDMLPRPSRRGTPHEWTSMSSVPLPSTAVAPISNYAPAPPPYTSSLKRAWSIIDAA